MYTGLQLLVLQMSEKSGIIDKLLRAPYGLLGEVVFYWFEITVQDNKGMNRQLSLIMIISGGLSDMLIQEKSTNVLKSLLDIFLLTLPTSNCLFSPFLFRIEKPAIIT